MMQGNWKISLLRQAGWGKNLPCMVLLVLIAGHAQAEGDPGRVDAYGRVLNRKDQSVQVILPDKNTIPLPGKVSDLRNPTRLRALEPVRTIRQFLPDGRILFQNGRSVALLGCLFPGDSEKRAALVRRKWEDWLANRSVRLVFEEETRNASGELSAYVFLADGRLLNEELLKEGVCLLDMQAVLSPQYAERFQRAAAGEKQGILRTNHAYPPTQDSEFPKYPRRFSGFNSGSAAPDRAQRPGENKSSRGGLPAGNRHQPPYPQ